MQSVAVRLIVEREREIEQFVSEASYRIVATFAVATPAGETVEMKAELNTRPKTKEEAIALLNALPRRPLHHRRGAGKARPQIAGRPLHHLDPPTGGRTQAGSVGGTDHDYCPAPLRVGIHHLHAYRLGQSLLTRPEHLQGRNPQNLGREIPAHPQLPHQDQRRPGGPRSHTPHLHRPSRHRRVGPGKTPLRTHLETHHRLTDERCRDRKDHSRHRHLGPQGEIHRHGRSAEIRRFPACLQRVDRRRRRERRRQQQDATPPSLRAKSCRPSKSKPPSVSPNGRPATPRPRSCASSKSLA